MASRQDPTAADIAYAQYSAAEKTRTVGGRVYHRIICKTPLPAPVGGVELILPRAMFRGARAGCVEDERGGGLGRRLLEYGAEHYGIREVTVNEQNPQAVGFYEHMGFVTYKRTDRDEQGGPYPLLYMRRA